MCWCLLRQKLALHVKPIEREGAERRDAACRKRKVDAGKGSHECDHENRGCGYAVALGAAGDGKTGDIHFEFLAGFLYRWMASIGVSM